MTNTFIFRTLVALVLSVILTVPEVFGENRIFIDPVNIQRGETLEFPLILDNDQTFYGFQLDMILPEGLEVDNEGGILHITRTDRLNDSYSIIGNVLENGMIRMGAFSSTHTPISGNSGAISLIKIKAGDSFQGGSIVLSDILCISESDQDVSLNNESTYIELAGIESLFSETDEKVDVFTLNGLLLRRDCQVDDLSLLPPAIYIVRGKSVVKTLCIKGN